MKSGETQEAEVLSLGLQSEFEERFFVSGCKMSSFKM